MKLKIKDIMTSDPVMVPAGHSVHEAARLMKENDCGILPVGDPYHVIGMVTDRDITVRAIAAGRDTLKTKVSEIMTPRGFSCETEDSFEEAAERMRKHDVSRLLVNDGTMVVGIVTLADLLRAGGKEKQSDRVLHELLYHQGSEKKSA